MSAFDCDSEYHSLILYVSTIKSNLQFFTHSLFFLMLLGNFLRAVQSVICCFIFIFDHFVKLTYVDSFFNAA